MSTARRQNTGRISYFRLWSGITPQMISHWDFMQGDFFTIPALRMAAWIENNEEYLHLLYETLEKFEDYLWHYREKNGVLETYCLWDTGSDNCTLYLSRGVENKFEALRTSDTRPNGPSDLPFASPEWTAYAFAHQKAMEKISLQLHLGKEAIHRARADEIQKAFIKILWDENKSAAFPHDRNDLVIPCLTSENIKCLYQGIFTQEMADDFIKHHLMNPNEFLTPLPLPAIAANDPLFYVNDEYNNFSPETDAIVRPHMSDDMADNAWSGSVQGLNHLRIIDALNRYGHRGECTVIGRRWLSALTTCGIFQQQYNPKTGFPTPGMTVTDRHCCPLLKT